MSAGAAGKPARAFLSIGEVLAQLRPDFPDITISKIRFLESEGLVEQLGVQPGPLDELGSREPKLDRVGRERTRAGQLGVGTARHPRLLTWQGRGLEASVYRVEMLADDS